jgi:transcriptional regulator with XRE-family HTH domain
LNRFKLSRLNSGLQQKTVASELGVSVQSMSYWESGSRTPSKENLLRLAEMYGVTTDYLLGKDTEEPAASDTKKEPVVSNELDERLVQALTGLNEDEVQRILDFASGVRSRRGSLPSQNL